MFIRGGCPTENKYSVNDFSGVHRENGYGLPRKHILISTDAGSAGVNLQACNVMVNYDLPWVPMTIEQRIGRIQRLGQTAQHVIVNNFSIANTIDETIVLRLWERIQLFELAIGELEAILKEAEEGGSADFEDTLFQLIILSKEKRDEEVAQQIEEWNRAEAFRQLKEEQERNEELLGALVSSKKSPHFTPRQPLQPRLQIRDFRQMAFEHLGQRTKYQPNRDILYVEFKKQTQLVGNWEAYTFAELDVVENGDAAKELRLLAEGTKDFGVLLRHVLNQGRIFIRSYEPLEEVGEESCLQVLQQNLPSPVHLIGLRLGYVKKYHTAWRLTWKITTKVARDRFEKLLHGFLSHEDKRVVETLSSLPSDQRERLPFWEEHNSDLRPPDKTIVATFTAEAEQDDDVQEFEEHYTQVKEVRIEELTKWFKNRSHEEILDRDQGQARASALDGQR